MPYIKFDDDKERIRARQVINSLVDGSEVSGLIAIMDDPNHRLIYFLSEKPYLDALEEKSINYKIISKDLVSAPYANFLRHQHPDNKDL